MNPIRSACLALAWQDSLAWFVASCAPELDIATFTRLKNPVSFGGVFIFPGLCPTLYPIAGDLSRSPDFITTRSLNFERDNASGRDPPIRLSRRVISPAPC
jgi:hypothetical protein